MQRPIWIQETQVSTLRELLEWAGSFEQEDQEKEVASKELIEDMLQQLK